MYGSAYLSVCMYMCLCQDQFPASNLSLLLAEGIELGFSNDNLILVWSQLPLTSPVTFHFSPSPTLSPTREILETYWSKFCHYVCILGICISGKQRFKKEVKTNKLNFFCLKKYELRKKKKTNWEMQSSHNPVYYL